MQLLVSAYDTLVPEMQTSVTVQISVQKNLFAPIFSVSDYETTIYDFEPIGHEVIRVNATDRDVTSPENIIIYSLSDNTKYFSINSYNGIVRVADLLTSDARSPNKYTVSINNFN